MRADVKKHDLIWKNPPMASTLSTAKDGRKCNKQVNCVLKYTSLQLPFFVGYVQLLSTMQALFLQICPLHTTVNCISDLCTLYMYMHMYISVHTQVSVTYPCLCCCGSRLSSHVLILGDLKVFPGQVRYVTLTACLPWGLLPARSARITSIRGV